MEKRWQLDFEVWLSLVERFVRDEEAAGSNPVTSTNGGKPLKACRLFFSFTQTGFEKMKKVLTEHSPCVII